MRWFIVISLSAAALILYQGKKHYEGAVRRGKMVYAVREECRVLNKEKQTIEKFANAAPQTLDKCYEQFFNDINTLRQFYQMPWHWGSNEPGAEAVMLNAQASCYRGVRVVKLGISFELKDTALMPLFAASLMQIKPRVSFELASWQYRDGILQLAVVLYGI